MLRPLCFAKWDKYFNFSGRHGRAMGSLAATWSVLLAVAALMRQAGASHAAAFPMARADGPQWVAAS